MKSTISDFWLYKWRYWVGYGFISLLLIGALYLAVTSVPGGITEQEMASAVISDALKLTDISTLGIINLPYHILQYLSISTLGVSILSIKLPSVILALVSAVAMIILLRSWFTFNVAVLASVLTVATGQFIFVAQSGTASILYIFWPVVLLLAATMISRQEKFLTFWKIILFAAVGLSLYTPLSIYVIITLISAAVLHPHLRFIVKRLSKPKLLIGAVVGTIVLVPLGYAVFQNPSLGLTLLGIPAQMPDLYQNLITLFKQYFDIISPESGRIMLPIFGFGSLALILLGLFRLATSRYTARSYIVTLWSLLLLPILVINPTFITIMFVPLLLLMAMGIDELIRSWYKLFPLNPYARLAGLVPLIMLMGTLTISGVDRYFYGYHYDPAAKTAFSRDITLINTELRRDNVVSPVIVTSEKEKSFYEVLARRPVKGSATPITVTTSFPDAPKQTVLLLKSSGVTPPANPSRIVTSSLTTDADRLYIYKKS